jgi:hypothetical protein
MQMVGHTIDPDLFDRVVKHPRAAYTLPLDQEDTNQDHAKMRGCPHPYTRTETRQSCTFSEYKYRRRSRNRRFYRHSRPWNYTTLLFEVEQGLPLGNVPRQASGKIKQQI